MRRVPSRQRRPAVSPDLAPIAAVGRRDPAASSSSRRWSSGNSVSLPATLEDLVPLLRPPLALMFAKRPVQMVCAERVPEPPGDVGIHLLSESDSADMLALATLTQPGPFRPRSYTFGTYVGVRVDGVLAAMGGQRMHLPGHREVSAICTHPDFRGRGYARAIVARLVAITFDEGLTPFRTCRGSQPRAQKLYRDLGCRTRACRWWSSSARALLT